MEYLNILMQDRKRLWDKELFVGKNNVYDYKISKDGHVSLISDPEACSIETVTFGELVKYCKCEDPTLGCAFTLIDEVSGNYLTLKDELETKLIFELECN